jgi:RNase P subunit RPR2
MKKQYLHLSAYPCDNCSGPVVAGSTAVRENEISRETDIRKVGAICLSCGHRQSQATERGLTHDFPPMSWEPRKATEAGLGTTA